MKQVKFSFNAKLFAQILPGIILAVFCAATAGSWWSVSAADRPSADSDFSGRTVNGATANRIGNKKSNSFSLLPYFPVTSSNEINLLFPLPDDPTSKALVRHGFTLNGRIEGSVQQLLGENTIFNSSAVLTGDLLVLGSPNLIRNGTSTFGGTVVGSGNAQPNNYSVTLNSSSLLGRLLTRINAASMPTVSAPPAPSGTRSVTINNSTQSIGDFATLRNLTLNSNVGNKAIPSGTYGNFTANSGSGFILGTAGSTQPAVYNFNALTLNNSQLQIAGPVVITLGTGLTLNGSMGSSTNPGWLELKIAAGGVTLNSGSALHGNVVAPSGKVTLNGQLTGNVAADRLTINSNGLLRIIQQGDTTPPTINLQQPANGAVVNAPQITVSGSYSDVSQTTININNIPATIVGNNFTATVSLNEGSNTLTLFASDSYGNQSTIIRTVVRDSVNPVLTVVQPAENDYVKTPTLTVLGTFNEQTATTVTVNGVAATITGNNYTATIPVIEGANTIVTTATDAAGNSVEVRRSVIRDTIPPVLTIQQPADESVTSDPTILVTGTINDSNPVSITINGVEATISGNNYSASAPLINGPGLVIVNAVDAAGNETSQERRVTSATSLTMNLQQPTENLVTNSKSVRVEGVVSGIGAHLTVNGNSFELLSGSIFGGDINLNEGSNTVHIIATDIVGRTQELTRTVIVDTTAPAFSEISPAEGETIDSPTATIRGKVTDATTTTVEINNSSVSVDSDGHFTINDFLITEGVNTITIKASDQVGNSQIANLILNGKDRTPPPAPVIFPGLQETVLTFITLEGRAEPGTALTINGGTESVVAEAAAGSGLFFANVPLANGINTLSIISRDRTGNNSSPVVFNVTSDPSKIIPSQQAVKINIATNDAQKGLTGQLLPRPLIARVTDKQGAPVEAVEVKFTVLYGDGQLGGTANEVSVTTDEEGQASVSLQAGTKKGIQLIRADFEGNLYKPVTFTAEILEPSGNQQTAVMGRVFDQNLRALPNVLVRLGGQQTRTNNEGRFTMTNVQSGAHQILELIGRDQVPYPGRWTNISYDIDVLPGINNTPGKPLFLPKVNAGINLPLNNQGIVTQDTTYELPVVGGQPPVRVTARAGTHVSFPPDVTDKRFSVTRIDANRVPMALEDGRATNLYISVQPSGAVFEPALEVSFPNLDGLNANEKTLLMSFDHDAGRYVQVGTAHVSADGLVVKSDPGSGIHIGAWHAVPPENPQPEATILSFVQIEGNPAFENKEVEVTEASVLSVRAVPYNEEMTTEGKLSKIHLRGVVSFPRNTPPQTGKVLAFANTADPEFQFDTGAFDFKNKELFLAENEEITLTWKVAGGLSPSYTIDCTKPDEKKVKVTLCDATTIKIKGVVGKYDDAGSTNFTVKAVGGKVKEAKIKVNLVKVRYKEYKVSSGFDNLMRGDMQDKSKLKFSAAPLTPVGVFIGDTFKKDPNDPTNETKEPWLSVVKDYKVDPQFMVSTQKARFEVKPESATDFIKFVSQDPAKADVDSFDKQAKTLTVKAVATTGTAGPANETKVIAKLDQNAYKAENFEFGKLQVAVRKNVKANVAFYFLKDAAANVTPRLNPRDIDDYIKEINDILTPQTGIEYTKYKVIHWEATKSFNYVPTTASNLGLLQKNFGRHTTPEDWTEIATGKDASNNPSTQPKLCDTGADREVYIVHNVELKEAVANTETDGLSGAFWDLHGTIITDQKAPFVLAHEIGHSIYIRPADAQYRYYECYNKATTPAGQQAMCLTDPTQTNATYFDQAHSAVKREMMFKYDDNSKGYYIPKEDVDQGINQTSGYDWLKGGFKKRPC